MLFRLINFLQKWPQFGEVGQRVGYGTNQGLSLLRTTLESARANLCQKSAFQKTTLENLATYTHIFVLKPWHKVSTNVFISKYYFCQAFTSIGSFHVCPWSTCLPYVGAWWELRSVSIKFLFLLSPPSIARHLLSCWCWSSHWTPTSACSRRFCLLGNLQESGTYTYNDTMMQSDTAETAGCWVIPVGKSQMKQILNNNWRGTILQTTQYRMFTEWIYGKLSLHLFPRSESMILQNLLEICKN